MVVNLPQRGLGVAACSHIQAAVQQHRAWVRAVLCVGVEWVGGVWGGGGYGYGGRAGLRACTTPAVLIPGWMHRVAAQDPAWQS